MSIGKSKSANRTDFNDASGMSFPKAVPKSGRDHWSSALDGGRKEMATSWNHSGKVGKSGGDGIGDPKGFKGKRNRADHQWDATPHSHFAPIPHSDPKAPGEAKSWKRRGYAMVLPVTMAEGAKYK
jgi:hypothetical protein